MGCCLGFPRVTCSTFQPNQDYGDANSQRPRLSYRGTLLALWWKEHDGTKSDSK